jgi:hypothetical protein
VPVHTGLLEWKLKRHHCILCMPRQHAPSLATLAISAFLPPSVLAIPMQERQLLAEGVSGWQQNYFMPGTSDTGEQTDLLSSAL